MAMSDQHVGGTPHGKRANSSLETLVLAVSVSAIIGTFYFIIGLPPGVSMVMAFPTFMLGVWGLDWAWRKWISETDTDRQASIDEFGDFNG